MAETKQCYRCKETRPLSEFKLDKRMADGHHSWCVDCWRAYHRERYRKIQADPEKKAKMRKAQTEWARRDRKAKPEQHKGYVRKYRLGVDRQAYEAMVLVQDGLCAIPGCGREGTELDHDRTCCPGKGKACGKCIRQILCKPCNVMLGFARDNPEVLRGAADYVERHAQRLKDVLSA